VAVHLGALISGHDSLKAPRDYFDANVGGLLTLVETLASVGARHVVFASSATIYGDGEAPKREGDEPQPLTPYAVSKLAGEHLLRMYAPLHSFTHASLRLFNVYGPRQSPNHPYANVTCKFAHAVAERLPVRLYGDGDQARDFVYVDDVVDALVAAMAPTPAPVYNVGTGRATSIRRLIMLLEAVAGVELKIEHYPAWPNDVRATRADASAIARDLGVTARTPLLEGLRRTVDYFRERGR
jgi:UDP-glucose 4-epimerase